MIAQRSKFICILLLFVVLTIILVSCDMGDDTEPESTMQELTIEIIGEGEVLNESGETLAEGEGGTIDVKEDSTISLEAKPARSWEFDRWEGEVTSPDDKNTKINMDSSKNIIVVFNYEVGDIPGELQFSDMEITPEENITPRTEVEVSVKVDNIGQDRIEHELVLFVNGDTFARRDLDLSPGEEKEVSFEFSPVVEDDHLHIEIGHLEKHLELDTHLEEELEEIYIDGDIVLEDDETKKFSNKEISIEGNIKLYDNSELIFEDSKIDLKSNYPAEYQVELEDEAALVVDNSFLEAEPGKQVNEINYQNSWTLRLEDESEIEKDIEFLTSTPIIIETEFGN